MLDRVWFRPDIILLYLDFDYEWRRMDSNVALYSPIQWESIKFVLSFFSYSLEYFVFLRNHQGGRNIQFHDGFALAPNDVIYS